MVVVNIIRTARIATGVERRIGLAWKRNGRHEETRTPDLYRVKVAL
jgi:hypothetical protein